MTAATVYRKSSYTALPRFAGTSTLSTRGQFRPTLTVHLRSWAPSDLNFIRDTWATSYRKCGTDSDAKTERHHYNVEMRARMTRLFERSATVVACDPEDQTLIRGYVVYEKPQRENQLPVLHYVLVRPEYQHAHLGRKLIELVRESAFVPDSLIYASHVTAAIRAIADKYGIVLNTFCKEV